MKIHEAEVLAEVAHVVVRFMVSRQHPELLAERLERLAAAVEAAAECGKVARRDVKVGGLRDDARQRPHVAMNVAEDQDFHGAFFSGGAGRATGCCGTRSRIRRPGIPSVSQPCSTSLPALVKDHLVGEWLRAAAASLHRAVFAELDHVHAALGEAADRRKAREMPVELHLGHRERAQDVIVGRRVGDKIKGRRILFAQIELRDEMPLGVRISSPQSSHDGGIGSAPMRSTSM